MNLYLGDVDEGVVLEWLCENISPVACTSRAEYSYFNMYHGEDDRWIMDTQDVSDASYRWDTITQIQFRDQEDFMLTKLRWGGTSE